MSDLKVTVITNNEPDSVWDPEVVLNNKQASYLIAYCVGKAHLLLPEEQQRHFQHVGIQIWNHENGLAAVHVTLVVCFPFQREEVPHKQVQEFKRVIKLAPPVDMFTSGPQNDQAIAWLKSEFLRTIEEHLRLLERELTQATKRTLEQLRSVAGVRAVG